MLRLEQEWFLCFTNEKWDTMQWASIETKISSEVREKEIAPICPRSVHRRGGKFNKRKDHKNESNAQTFHSRKVIHHIAFTHCIRYMFSYLKQECREKKGLALNKSFRKTFREKEDNSNRSEFSKNSKSQPSWQSRVSPRQIYSRLSPVQSAFEENQDEVLCN